MPRRIAHGRRARRRPVRHHKGPDRPRREGARVDDQPLLRDVLAEFLELLGREADLVADGPEGLARFDPLVHQIVLTDFLMPGLTGLEVAAAIRARGCTTPIVMISGFAKPDDEREAVEAGLRVVRKPLTFAQFEATMAAVVERVDATH